jgi:hypothetical protein
MAGLRFTYGMAAMSPRSFLRCELLLGALSPLVIAVGLYFICRWHDFWEVLMGAWILLCGVAAIINSVRILKDFATGPLTATGRVVNRRTERHSGRAGMHSVSYHLSLDTEQFQVSEEEYNAVADGEVICVKYWPTLRTVESVEPFCPKVDPAWLTAKVVALAQAIYDDRAFDRLPILADALEDAGCTNQDILAHCRQPGEHVRGCWVVDLLLGKS